MLVLLVFCGFVCLRSVPNITCVSGLSFLDYPSVFSNVYVLGHCLIKACGVKGYYHWIV